ncbi:peptidyl-prolyl cis-trans isomerase [Adhaeribacter aerolatus]|uniref:peptidylprolyl isomerase n=1 Tax=Adhaeribacter aerolatus TaxID=670289 RepID=A0A512AU75_9BACT|nr:peptidylprolyl isomerase [Adhaeribacter aerolatus]GEO03265.1 peptidyl-prolyl cis-trans isomerase [Adhaeribacter aerolatus]
MARIYLILLLFIFACQRPMQTGRVRHEKHPIPVNKFADATLRQIITLQDERKTDQLLPFLQHASPVYRQQAALALASVQAPATIPALVPLLADKESIVRRAAAYALGQIGDVAAEDILIRYVTLEKTAAVHAEITEALGKCATQKGLNFLTSFTLTNDTEKAGQMWGIYRTNAKNLNYRAAARKAVSYLDISNIQPVRLGAAHFLARTPKLNLAPYSKSLSQFAATDPSPEVRMALASALAKAKAADTEKILLALVQKDSDYRVRINAIRALSSADFASVKETIYTALNDKNPNTALAAADYLLIKASPAETNILLKQAEEQTNWRVRATLLAAALKTKPEKDALGQKIMQRFSQSPNIYEQGALLSALAQDFQAYPFIQEATFANISPVLASYGIQALADMRKEKNFPDSLKATFAGIFQRAIEADDVALIAISAGLLQQPELNFKAAYPDPSFLKTARDKLLLPRDMETYQELDKTIRYFEDLPPAPAPPNPYTHPIDWALVQQIKPRQKVSLLTAQGVITLELFTEEAPATVANFVQLARTGFFDGKNFHRVVPNFVVQGGDPRGDGWGSTDYAIRSELANLRYGEGYVGMASAGKDTESCQWFITHSPTPHLDGRYTIFAKVISGMETVHRLEIDDKIQKLSLID